MAEEGERADGQALFACYGGIGGDDRGVLAAPGAPLVASNQSRPVCRSCTGPQSRFASYPMDDAHLPAAIRYVENNPVATGMVEAAKTRPPAARGCRMPGADTRAYVSDATTSQ